MYYFSLLKVRLGLFACSKNKQISKSQNSLPCYFKCKYLDLLQSAPLGSHTALPGFHVEGLITCKGTCLRLATAETG